MAKIAPTPFQFEIVRLVPRAQIRAHVQDTWELGYVQSGRGERTLGDCTVPFSAPDIALVPPGLRHRWRFDPGCTEADGKISNIAVQISDTWLRQIVATVPAFDSEVGPLLAHPTPCLPTSPDAPRIAHLIEHAIPESAAIQTARILEALVLLARSATANPVPARPTPSTDDRRWNDLEIYVQCNYMHDLGLGEITRAVGMSRSAFCPWFKIRTGKTFVEWLTDYRLKKACHLLTSTPASVSEIAEATGFIAPNYFNRVFKCRLGVTPRSWRISSTQL